MMSGMPTARITAAIAFVSVQQERTYSFALKPSRIFSRTNDWNVWGAATALALAMVILLLGAGLLGLFAAPRERVEPHEQRGPKGHHEGRGAERAGDEARDRGLRDVRPERELVQLDVGDVQPGRAAGLVLAVDVRDVLAGVRVDAPLRLLEQLTALAEGERAGGADLGARGLQALRLAVRTEHALADARGEAVVLVLRHVERARDHAVAAAHAAGCVVDDRAARELVERADRARGRAARGDAVHALLLREANRTVRLLRPVDDREHLRRRVSALQHHLVVLGRRGELVLLRAGALARTAADAEGRVDEHAWPVAPL